MGDILKFGVSCVMEFGKRGLQFLTGPEQEKKENAGELREDPQATEFENEESDGHGEEECRRCLDFVSYIVYQISYNAITMREETL